MLGSQSKTWVPLMIALSIATMIVGATMALVQKDLKRLLGFPALAMWVTCCWRLSPPVTAAT